VKKIERSFLSGFLAVIFLVVLIGCESVPEREFVDHVPADLLLESVPYTLDEKGRMFIDALVNGSGPYTFVIDTA